jgi:hypothetical protein
MVLPRLRKKVGKIFIELNQLVKDHKASQGINILIDLSGFEGS